MSEITHTLAFSLGGPEMILIFCIVLLLFGAKKLPQLARGIGKSAGEFKRARDEFEREISRAETETATEKPKSSETSEPRDKKETTTD